jgi:hypothetical protein
MPKQALSKSNPGQHLSSEVAQALNARHTAVLEDLNLQNEIVPTKEINQEYRAGLSEIYKVALEPTGVDLQQLADRVRDITATRNEKVATSLKRLLDLKRLRFTTKFGDLPVSIPKPVAQDPSFWWATTYYHAAPGQTTTFPDDGLHFYGGPKVNDWNGSETASFGAVAAFGISRDRFPASASGNYVSNPYIELFGGMTLFAPDWDLFQGHGIANCNLFLRQTLYQNYLGGPKTVGEAVVTGGVWWVNLEDTGYSRTLAMPGYLNMPSVTFNQNQLDAADPLWSELEVRFDINLKAEGALAWCDPEVLLRTFQWPLVSL